MVVDAGGSLKVAMKFESGALVATLVRIHLTASRRIVLSEKEHRINSHFKHSDGYNIPKALERYLGSMAGFVRGSAEVMWTVPRLKECWRAAVNIM